MSYGMNTPRTAGLLLIPVLLLGCSVASTIQRADGSQSAFDGAVYGGDKQSINPEMPGSTRHRVFHQASTGFVTIAAIRESAQQRAKSITQKEFEDEKAKLLSR